MVLISEEKWMGQDGAGNNMTVSFSGLATNSVHRTRTHVQLEHGNEHNNRSAEHEHEQGPGQGQATLNIDLHFRSALGWERPTGQVSF